MTRRLQRLDLGLLVERQHDRVTQRVHAHAHNILRLRREGRFRGTLKTAYPARLQVVRFLDALDRAQRDTNRFSQVLPILCVTSLCGSKQIGANTTVTATVSVEWGGLPGG